MYYTKVQSHDAFDDECIKRNLNLQMMISSSYGQGFIKIVRGWSYCPPEPKRKFKRHQNYKIKAGYRHNVLTFIVSLQNMALIWAQIYP
jgi:hypothetical protein